MGRETVIMGNFSGPWEQAVKFRCVGMGSCDRKHEMTVAGRMVDGRLRYAVRFPCGRLMRGVTTTKTELWNVDEVDGETVIEATEA